MFDRAPITPLIFKTRFDIKIRNIKFPYLIPKTHIACFNFHGSVSLNLNAYFSIGFLLDYLYYKYSFTDPVKHLWLSFSAKIVAKNYDYFRKN